MSRTIYYRTHPNGGVVFADPYDAERISRIHTAIAESRTWGEFRQKMDPDEFQKIVVDPSGELQSVPDDDDAFSAAYLPAYCDGLYPDWLQEGMDYLIPDELLRKYGKVTSTPNGSYWHIEKEVIADLVKELQAMDIKAIERTDLSFY